MHIHWLVGAYCDEQIEQKMAVFLFSPTKWRAKGRNWLEGCALARVAFLGPSLGWCYLENPIQSTPFRYDQNQLKRRLLDCWILPKSPGIVVTLSLGVIWVFHGVSKNSGTPRSSILIGFSIINHPFWGIPIFGNTHMSWTGIGWNYMELVYVQDFAATDDAKKIKQRCMNKFFCVTLASCIRVQSQQDCLQTSLLLTKRTEHSNAFCFAKWELYFWLNCGRTGCADRILCVVHAGYHLWFYVAS